jgi:hypothetical protein
MLTRQYRDIKIKMHGRDRRKKKKKKKGKKTKVFGSSKDTRIRRRDKLKCRYKERRAKEEYPGDLPGGRPMGGGRIMLPP